MLTEQKDRPLERMMDNSYNGIKKILSADTVLGSPVVTNDGVSIIPVCRITMGFLTGGGEYGTGSFDFPDLPFAGGSGTGMSVNPVGFLVCDGSHVKLVCMDDKSIMEYVAQAVPELVKAVLSKNNEKKNN